MMNDGLTERIIECVIVVHQTLGPGFVEKVYRRALVIELRSRGLATEVEKEVIIYYRRRPIGRHCLDLVVENAVILELKAVEAIHKAHYMQVRSYLKAFPCETALLINFATPLADIRRISP